MSHSTSTTAHQTPLHLPCRGCMTSCPHYAGCDGKPWRDLGAEKIIPAKTEPR